MDVNRPESEHSKSADDIRAWIVRELAELLRVAEAEIDTAAPLNRLGVDSLAAFTMTGELAAWLDRDLPATLVWDYPTIDAIADGLADASAPEAAHTLPRGVIALQESGDRTPIFFLPGVGGHPTSFRAVAEQLGEDQPSYGLTTPGLDDDAEPLSTVPEIARAAIHSMRMVQPNGPYQLAGYSFGGLLAFEMACELSRQGEGVKLLAIYDTFTPGGRVMRPAWQRAPIHLSMFVRRPDRIDYVRRRLQRQRTTSQPDFDQFDEAQDPGHWPREHVQRVVRSNRTAAATYVPGHYPGRIVLFRAADRAWHSAFMRLADDNGWGEHAGGGVSVVHLPGTHRTLFAEAHLPAVAGALRVELAR